MECLTDVLKTIPILFIVYIVICWMETRMDAVTRIVTSTEPVGPIIGALVGAIPQCGFSVGCSALYCRGFLAPATLIAVYLSTSDEAIPVPKDNERRQRCYGNRYRRRRVLFFASYFRGRRSEKIRYGKRINFG